MIQGHQIISIHTPRVGRDTGSLVAQIIDKISIHTPRVGRDDQLHLQKSLVHDFNPHAPCGA